MRLLLFAIKNDYDAQRECCCSHCCEWQRVTGRWVILQRNFTVIDGYGIIRQVSQRNIFIVDGCGVGWTIIQRNIVIVDGTGNGVTTGVTIIIVVVVTAAAWVRIWVDSTATGCAGDSKENIFNVLIYPNFVLIIIS